MAMELFIIATVVIVLAIIVVVWRSVKSISNTEVHVGIHEALTNEEASNKAKTTVVMEVQPTFKEELEKAQQKLQKDNEREDALKAERLKIEQAKRQRQVEVTRRERQIHDSGVISPSSQETPYWASEPSYNSGDSCSSSSSSSSHDSGSSSSSSSYSSDSGSSSYSSCD